MTNNYTFKIKSTYTEIESLCIKINDLAQNNNFSDKIIFCLNICIEEMLTNIVKYAYDDKNEHEIEVILEIAGKIITLTIVDDGHEFNPLKAKMPDVSSDIKHRQIGGIGIFLTLKMADKVSYNRRNSKNFIKILLSSTHRSATGKK